MGDEQKADMPPGFGQVESPVAKGAPMVKLVARRLAQN